MKKNTKLTHWSRNPSLYDGMVSNPLHRSSTIIYPDFASFTNKKKVKYSYGRHGNPTYEDLADALNALEGANSSFLFPSGTSAITSTFMSLCESGDEVLIADNCYYPTRNFADNKLRKFGVEVNYFNPTCGKKIADLVSNKTKIVFIEEPGTSTFDLSDVALISEQVKKINAQCLIIVDNTWASGYFFNPIKHGADISIISLSKYIGGYSDMIIGAVCSKQANHPQLIKGRSLLGACVSPDDCYNALRGMRSLGARLSQHQKNAQCIAQWLYKHPLVKKILYPAHKSSEFYPIYCREFSGASSVFGFVIDKYPYSQMEKMMDSLKIFAMGYGWGGFESLLIPVYPNPYLRRVSSVDPYENKAQYMRIHVGLEDTEDLIADLDRAFNHLSARRD